MRFGLSKSTVDEILEVFRKYPAVKKALIYGSRAMGTHRPGSDIDLAVFGTGLTHHDIIKIGADLDDMDMLYTFDVLLYDKLKNAELKEHIDRVGKEIYTAEVSQDS